MRNNRFNQRAQASRSEETKHIHPPGKERGEEENGFVMTAERKKEARGQDVAAAVCSSTRADVGV